MCGGVSAMCVCACVYCVCARVTSCAQRFVVDLPLLNGVLLHFKHVCDKASNACQSDNQFDCATKALQRLFGSGFGILKIYMTLMNLKV